MQITIHRTAVTTRAESEETLAETINVSHVHALLYKRGETALADQLAAHLGPKEARALAENLRRVVHRASRPGLFTVSTIADLLIRKLRAPNPGARLPTANGRPAPRAAAR